jgi:hypothetical protein
MTEKQNSGPRVTLFKRTPRARSPARQVWFSATEVLGFPPSWMRMIPARRVVETKEGTITTKTTRWEIGTGESVDDPEIVVNGAAKRAAFILVEMKGE